MLQNSIVVQTCIIVAVVFLGLLIGAALPALLQLRRTLKAAENLLRDSGPRLDRALSDASEAAARINRISVDVETSAEHLKGFVELLESTGDLAGRLSGRIRAVDSVTKALGAALVAGFRAVWPDGKEAHEDFEYRPPQRAFHEKEESQS